MTSNSFSHLKKSCNTANEQDLEDLRYFLFSETIKKTDVDFCCAQNYLTNAAGFNISEVEVVFYELAQTLSVFDPGEKERTPRASRGRHEKTASFNPARRG